MDKEKDLVVEEEVDSLTEVVIEIFEKLKEVGIKDEDTEFFQSRMSEMIQLTQNNTLKEAISLMGTGKNIAEDSEVFISLNCSKCGKPIWIDTAFINGGLCTDCFLGYYKDSKGKVSHIVNL